MITRRISYSTPEPEVTPEAPEATSPSTDTDTDTGTSEDTYTETAEVDTTEDRDLGTEVHITASFC